tara:strand:- start:1451 stop:1645 length:195 start_codon:yes stop_codon:yes gene_type:complete
MLRKTVIAAMLAASALASFPQAAQAARGDECELNCFWTTVYGPDGQVMGGYWTCSGIYMDCVEP